MANYISKHSGAEIDSAIGKIINQEYIHKHDIESNWNTVGSFIPELGEILIYDIDNNYSYERFKIGDGKTTIADLPFYLEHEIDNVIDKIKFLAENMIDTKWQNGILTITKGIVIP